VNRVIFFLGLLFPVSCATTESINDKFEPQVQACVLYEINENNGYPIPKQRCVETHLGGDCNEKVVDSDNSHKIWRAYPMSDCRDPGIKAGLSERYLREGID
jgi:hypothetical protein